MCLDWGVLREGGWGDGERPRGAGMGLLRGVSFWENGERVEILLSEIGDER